MRHIYTPIRDVSLYEQYTTRQAGADEILDIGKEGDGQYSIRTLLQFDLTSISQSVAAGTIDLSAEYDLRLFYANATSVVQGQTVYAFPVSESWTEGQGYFYQEPYTETNGASWRYKSTGSLWATSGASEINSISSSVEFNPGIKDLEFSVTTIVRDWISGSYSSNGFLLRYNDADESVRSNNGKLQFFSLDSHTIHLPQLVAKWNDQIYSTGSLSSSANVDLTIYPTNLRPYYRTTEQVRVDFTSRQRSPIKSFSTTFEEWSTKHVPENSYYSVVDMASGVVVIPFDDYSKISSDSTGNYITLRFDGMYPERWYRLLVKADTSSGHSYIFDDNYVFKVVK